jgi:hypothetical protein
MDLEKLESQMDSRRIGMNRAVRGLGDFLNFVVLNAGRANTNPLGSALHHGMNPLQIDIPAPRRDVMGVAHTVSEPGPAAANLAYLRHFKYAPNTS